MSLRLRAFLAAAVLVTPAMEAQSPPAADSLLNQLLGSW